MWGAHAWGREWVCLCERECGMRGGNHVGVYWVQSGFI